jgi:polyketide cyclase/dehydrase/lipid transport protein
VKPGNYRVELVARADVAQPGIVMTTEPAWVCQQSVDVDVPVGFAWRYMTDVRNWSDPPAEFTLDGPFASGTQGTTRMPGQPANSWTIRDVDPGRAYTIEAGSFLKNASLVVHWQFDALSEQRTRLTQRMELCGPHASRHTDKIRAAFEPNLEPGMRRIARMMERAADYEPRMNTE